MREEDSVPEAGTSGRRPYGFLYFADDLIRYQRGKLMCRAVLGNEDEGIELQ
jgi:hypothetical protein